MKRKCAVCGNTSQVNVCLKWQRHSDGKIFHICALCAEKGEFTAETLIEETTKTYTTVDSEVVSENNEGSLRQRATMSSFYKNGGSRLAPSVRYRRTK